MVSARSLHLLVRRLPPDVFENSAHVLGHQALLRALTRSRQTRKRRTRCLHSTILTALNAMLRDNQPWPSSFA
jgi:hypothetical protein